VVEIRSAFRRADRPAPVASVGAEATREERNAAVRSLKDALGMGRHVRSRPPLEIELEAVPLEWWLPHPSHGWSALRVRATSPRAREAHGFVVRPTSGRLGCVRRGQETVEVAAGSTPLLKPWVVSSLTGERWEAASQHEDRRPPPTRLTTTSPLEPEGPPPFDEGSSPERCDRCGGFMLRAPPPLSQCPICLASQDASGEDVARPRLGPWPWVEGVQGAVALTGGEFDLEDGRLVVSGEDVVLEVLAEGLKVRGQPLACGDRVVLHSGDRVTRVSGEEVTLR
jgi:hypothetical protein